MAAEMLKKFFYNLFSYFSNEETNVLVLQSASIGPDGSSVDPEPLQVASESDAADPETAKTASPASVEDSSSPEGCGGDCGKPASDQVVGNAAAITRDVDNALPKSSLCADSLYQDLSTAVGNDSCNAECAAAVEAEGDERDKLCPENVSSDGTLPVSNTSNFTEDEKGVCRVTEKETLAVECSEHSVVEDFNSTNQDSAETKHLIPAFPSTDFKGSRCTDANVNGELCALHCLIHKQSSVNLKLAAQTQVQMQKVRFNSPLFSEGDFEMRILQEKVCLEFVLLDSKEIHGYVRVLNTTYVKDVTVHYTKNDWKIVRTAKAEWVETVSNGTMDRFKFTIPGRRSVGNLSFSIKFNGMVDNNKGHHYTVAYETV